MFSASIRAFPTAARMGGAALALLALQAALLGPQAPVVVKVALVGIVALTFARPAAGLAVAMLVVPFGAVLVQALHLPAVRLTGAVVLAFLSGWLLREVRTGGAGRPPDRPPLWIPAFLLGLTVALSSAILLDVMLLGDEATLSFVGLLLQNLTNSYFSAFSTGGITQAGRLIEGIVLLTAAAAIASGSAETARRLAAVLVVAAVAAASLNLGWLVLDVGRHPEPGARFLHYLSGERLSVHVRDLNATASYFVMTALLALGLAAAAPGARARTLWTTAAGVLLVALWLSGSLSGLLAGALVAVVMIAQTCVVRVPSRAWRLATAGALVFLVVLVAPVFVARSAPGSHASLDAGSTIGLRAEFTRTSLRMLAERPLFGVGIGQYYGLSGRYMSPELHAIYPLENAHNYFLQVAAELGMVGLVLFCALLGVAAVQAWRGFRASGDVVLGGVMAGAAAYLLTCLTGHPLLVSETAFPFWAVAGLAAGTGRLHTARAGVTAPADRGVSRAVVIGVIAASAAMFAMVPIRVASEVREIRLEDASRGFYWWEQEPDGTRYRWMEREATLFVPADAQRVDIPLRAAVFDEDRLPFELEIRIGGRPVNRLRLADTEPIRTSLILPAARPDQPFWRLDLRVNRTVTPAAIFPGNPDHRNLGIQVGELEIFR